MSVTAEFKTDLLGAIPNLRAFAVSLTHNTDRADDLVQETLVKAWDKHASFQPGTNMKAWLFTILRNEFYSQMRKRGREVQDTDGAMTARLAVHPGQQGTVDLEDFRRVLQLLPEDQREAVILIGASGFSYEEAAEICGCAVGTIKSRVSRARTRLQEQLGVSGEADYGPDAIAVQGADQVGAVVRLVDDLDAWKVVHDLGRVGIACREDERTPGGEQLRAERQRRGSAQAHVEDGRVEFQRRQGIGAQLVDGAAYGDAARPMIEAQLFDIHRDQVLVLEHEYGQPCEGIDHLRHHLHEQAAARDESGIPAVPSFKFDIGQDRCRPPRQAGLAPAKRIS